MLYSYTDENGDKHYWWTAAPVEYRARVTSAQPNSVQSFVIETGDGEFWRLRGLDPTRFKMIDEKHDEPKHEPDKKPDSEPHQAADKPHEKPAKEASPEASSTTALNPPAAPAHPEASATPTSTTAAPAGTGTGKPLGYNPEGFAPSPADTHVACPGCNATNNVSKKSWLQRIEEAFERRCHECGRWLGLYSS